MTELFRGFASNLGAGFVQRASEAGQCHNFGAYLACCAMCGAAAESILLSVAVAKMRDEGAVLSLYRATGGRRKTSRSRTTNEFSVGAML